jgi:hypothetical protein
MNIKDFKKTEQEDVKQTFDKYKNLSKDELMSELLFTVNKQKQNGTFDKEQLLSTLALISPSLSEEQKQRLYSLVEKL